MNDPAISPEEMNRILVRSMVLNGDVIRRNAVAEPEHRVALPLTDAVERALAKRDMEEMREDLNSLLKDRDNALKYGVIVLGGVAATMLIWIFNFFALSKSGH